MRALSVALALAVLLALPAQAAPPTLAASVEAVSLRLVRVSATLPAGAVELCAQAGGGPHACAPGSAGHAASVVVPARPGQALAAWAGDRPYVVGGVGEVRGYVKLTAPGETVYLPGVNR